MVSGLQSVELTEQNRPLLVGERTNVLGSRVFKRLIAEDDLEAAAEVADRAGVPAYILGDSIEGEVDLGEYFTAKFSARRHAYGAPTQPSAPQKNI